MTCPARTALPWSAVLVAVRQRSVMRTWMLALSSRSALMMRRDDQTNDQDDRSGRKYQDHREDVLEDPVPARYALPVLQRHPGLGWMITRGRIVQVESSAAPAQAVFRVPSRAANPNHHASLPPLCGQFSAVQVARKDRTARCGTGPNGSPLLDRRVVQRAGYVAAHHEPGQLIRLADPAMGICLLSWVGVAGFEPAASSSRTKRAAKLRYTPPPMPNP
jgi:hypothetical protein